MDERVCQECQFWVPKDDENIDGRCHWEPVLVEKRADEWCGQWKRK